jgi:hypothetical protein
MTPNKKSRDYPNFSVNPITGHTKSFNSSQLLHGDAAKHATVTSERVSSLGKSPTNATVELTIGSQIQETVDFMPMDLSKLQIEDPVSQARKY